MHARNVPTHLCTVYTHEHTYKKVSLGGKGILTYIARPCIKKQIIFYYVPAPPANTNSLTHSVLKIPQRGRYNWEGAAGVLGLWSSTQAGFSPQDLSLTQEHTVK